VPYAWDGLARRPARTATTALGIGLATGLVVLLLSLSAGITASATSLAQSSGVDLLATSANTSLRSSSFPPVAGAHRFGAAMTAADPNVATASPWLIADLVFANASLEAAANRSPGGSAVPPGWTPTGSGMVGWIPGANAGISTPAITQGPGFPTPGDPHYANGTYAGPATHAIVLDEALAGVLGVGVGATVWAGTSQPTGPSALSAWFANATAFRVVGISGPFWLIPSALLAFTYLSELQSLLGGLAVQADTASLVLVHLHDPTQAPTDRSRLAAAFPGLTVFTVADILGAVQSVINLYRTFGTLVGAIGIAVALLFTTTVLLMSVDDRSREFAVLRAIGFGPGWIVRQVVVEGLLLGVLGLACGVPLGYVGALGVSGLLVRIVPGLPAGFSFVRFDGSVLLGALVIVVAVGLLAAIAPALRALTLPAAQELRAP
jgi:putative ABC transport system permease protein